MGHALHCLHCIRLFCLFVTLFLVSTFLGLDPPY